MVDIHSYDRFLPTWRLHSYLCFSTQKDYSYIYSTLCLFITHVLVPHYYKTENCLHDDISDSKSK